MAGRDRVIPGRQNRVKAMRQEQTIPSILSNIRYRAFLAIPVLPDLISRYSQTLLYRNAPYRIPYAFGMKSLNLEIFAGYIGIPRYKLLRNEVSRF